MKNESPDFFPIYRIIYLMRGKKVDLTLGRRYKKKSVTKGVGSFGLIISCSIQIAGLFTGSDIMDMRPPPVGARVD